MAAYYASDRLVAVLHELRVDFVALNPGATLRGLHDSLVHGTASVPELVLCLHENVAVGLAHGYAKAAGRPAAVALHDTVGVLNGAMGVFNAWADRAPMLILGGTGPLDANQRRPWIDWIHTVGESGAVIRPYTVWNDQPHSLEALVHSTRRAWRAAQTPRRGPAFVAVDSVLQEAEATGHEGGSLEPDFFVLPRLAPDPDVVREVARRLRVSKRPLLLADRPLSPSAADNLLALADLAGCGVVQVSDGANVPVGHELDVTDRAAEAIAAADLFVFVDVRDPAWALSQVDLATRKLSANWGDRAAVIIGEGDIGDQSWMVTRSGVPFGLSLDADPGLALEAIVDEWGPKRRPLDKALADLAGIAVAQPAEPEHRLSGASIAYALARAVHGHDYVIAAGNLDGWLRRALRFHHPGQHLGTSGGAGLGYAAPAAVGAALALRGTDRLTLAIVGDGDLLYTPQALWTAAHYGIPVLIIVNANRQYGQDKRHQLAVARLRDRDVARAAVGIDLNRPEVDYRQLAASLGVRAWGAIGRLSALETSLREAVATVASGEPALVEVETQLAP